MRYDASHRRISTVSVWRESIGKLRRIASFDRRSLTATFDILCDEALLARGKSPDYLMTELGDGGEEAGSGQFH